MNITQNTFADYEADFYHYMITEGGLGNKTSRDYISRLRFLSNTYTLDNHFTMERLREIIDKERSLMTTRDAYNNKHAIGDFHAGLKKFLNFVNYDYSTQVRKTEDEEVGRIENDHALSQTERSQIIKARLGQGDFRNDLIKYWHGCSISGFPMTSLLIASHIMPWRVANNEQRLDVYNGLLLLPNYDKLFDMGYITFKDDGRIVCSKFLDKMAQEIIGVNAETHLLKVEPQHADYLEYHRDKVFLG